MNAALGLLVGSATVTTPLDLVATGPAPVAMLAGALGQRAGVLGLCEIRPGNWEEIGTGCDIKQVIAFDSEGLLSHLQLREALKRPVVVLVSADGKTIDPSYTHGSREGKLFLIFPEWRVPSHMGAVRPASAWR